MRMYIYFPDEKVDKNEFHKLIDFVPNKGDEIISEEGNLYKINSIQYNFNSATVYVWCGDLVKE